MNTTFYYIYCLCKTLVMVVIFFFNVIFPLHRLMKAASFCPWYMTLQALLHIGASVHALLLHGLSSYSL